MTICFLYSDTVVDFVLEQQSAVAALLRATEQCNHATAILRNMEAGDLMDLRFALREADSVNHLAQPGTAVVRTLLLLLGESVADVVPHHVQMPRLVEKLLGLEMETVSLCWSMEVLDTAEEILQAGALTAPEFRNTL